MRRPLFWIAVLGGVAHAAIQDLRVAEIYPQDHGDPSVRYVRLHVGGDPSVQDNCLFPSSAIQVFDAAGNLLGADQAVQATTCLPGGASFTFATAAAGAAFGFTPDARLDVAIPPDAGQVCFASSLTRYDCVRWGNVTNPIADFDSPSDTTSAPSIPDGDALVRVSDTGVVANDFVLEGPSFMRPDAGVGIPDAAPIPDARPIPDATTADRFVPPSFPDAGPPPRWLSAEPGGGGCAVGGAGGGGWGILLVLLALRRRP